LSSLDVICDGTSTLNPVELEDALDDVIANGGTSSNLWQTSGLGGGTYTNTISCLFTAQDDRSFERTASATCEVELIVLGGCTPGYWKGNADNWDAVSWTDPLYQPDTTLAEAGFVTDKVDDSDTLREALSYNGGNFNKGGTERNLLRHAVANLLNAANSDVGSPIGSQQAVIDFTNAAIATQDKSSLESAKSTLAAANEQGCTINQQGIRSDD
jgi:hypothetical protein